MKNLSKFKITETEFTPNPQLMNNINSMLRCNNLFDGYVFVPTPNGKAKTGAFINENELGNRRLIDKPFMVLYYQKSTKKFYKLFDEQENPDEHQVSEKENK